MDLCLRFSHISVLLLLVIFSSAQVQEPVKEEIVDNTSDKKIVASNPCKQKTTCSECIAAHPSCAWCTRENYTTADKTRCDLITTLELSPCYDEIEHPKNTIEPQRDDPITRKGTAVENVIQLRPQEVRLKLRPNSPQSINVDFRLSEDYPVDLYYLMDLSKSMEDDKDKLATLGILLAQQMSQITQNFRLGFGSFVDKTVMPYVSTVPAKLEEPCTKCAAPYGFKNHLPLSTKTDSFAQEVKAAQVSGNLDAPEGGFDAIMQSIVCKGDIGWRVKSRKMLVFSTDSGFHYAGDGKLGGIVTPNDGECHLENGKYNMSTMQDYPSLSQLRHKISENKMNVIFAVTAGQVPIYKELSKNIEGAYTGQLENDSSNVVQLIKDQYMQITSEVALTDNAPSDVKITYRSKCRGVTMETTNVCKDLKIGEKVEFTAEVELLSCPKDPKDWKKSFKIETIGLNETLVVHLDMICECGCKKDGIPNSPKCNRHGTYQCGVCDCTDSGYHGRFCECGGDGYKGAQDDSTCKATNSSLICMARGTCSCGVCSCFTRDNPLEVISGQYCECDNYTCDRHKNLLCGGHGKCVCKKCECDEGWEGASCNCRKDDTFCRSANGKQCNDHGTCVCGTCRCDDLYSGPTCEECPTCTGKCQEYQACVQCQAFKTGKLKDQYPCYNCSFNATLMPEVKVEKEEERLCVFKDEEDDCKFTFVYGYDAAGKPEVRVQETKECPPAVNVLMIILGVILGIVAIGLLLLLIWKLLTTIHDRREFAKFEKERQMAKWDTGENPIYKQATSTFKNPTYGGKQ